MVNTAFMLRQTQRRVHVRLLWFLMWRFSSGEILRLPECGKFDFEATVLHRDKVINGANLVQYSGLSYMDCHQACIRNRLCESIGYHPNEGCKLNSADSSTKNSILLINEGWIHAETPTDIPNIGRVCRLSKPCLNDGRCKDICSSPGYSCSCNQKYLGYRCETFSNWGISFVSGTTNEQFYPKLIIPKVKDLQGFTLCLWFQLPKELSAGRKFLFSIHPVMESVTSGAMCNSYNLGITGETLMLRMLDIRTHVNTTWSDLSQVCVSGIINLYEQNNNYDIYVQGKILKTIVAPRWYVPEKAYRVIIGNDVDLSNGKCLTTNAGQGFIGNISEVSIWTYALSEREIENAYLLRPVILRRAKFPWEEYLNTFARNDNVAKIFQFMQTTQDASF